MTVLAPLILLKTVTDKRIAYEYHLVIIIINSKSSKIWFLMKVVGDVGREKFRASCLEGLGKAYVSQ